MLLYSLFIQSEFSRASDFLSALLDLNISTIVVKNSSQAMNILSAEIHLVHLIVLDAAFLEKEPMFISQLRLHHQYRHISVAVHNCEPRQSLGGSFLIPEPEDLKALIPALTEYATKTEILKFDLGSITQATFNFKSLAQGYLLAQFLSHQFPSSSSCLVGITELFINAVEHGNLQISYEDKSALLASGQWMEEVEKRLSEPCYQDKFVTVFFNKTPEKIEITVEDCGQGFDWHAFEKVDPRRFLSSHGRGIMMAKSLSFTSLEYEGTGNRVKAIFQIPVLT